MSAVFDLVADESPEPEVDLTELDDDVRRVLLALAIGFDISERMPPVGPPEKVALAMSRAYEARLLRADGTLKPAIRRVVLSSTPGYEIRRLQAEIVDALGGAPLETARTFAVSGYKDERIARELAEAADESLDGDPALAAELYSEAEASGLDAREIAARHAQASLAAGDLDLAGRLVDALFATRDAPDAARASHVAAAAWAQRGALHHSVETYRWAAECGVKDADSLLEIARLAVGEKVGGRAGGHAAGRAAEQAAERTTERAASPAIEPPSLFSEALALMAEGLRQSIESKPDVALPLLVQASDMITACESTVPLIEAPAVLAALVALYAGQLRSAVSVLDAALEGDQGGPALRPRLVLFRSLVALRAGDTAECQSLLDDVREGSGDLANLTPRDRVLYFALAAGLARRADDSVALMKAWQLAHEALLHVTPDLFLIPACEELVIAAARVRERHLVNVDLDAVWQLESNLGGTPLWSSHLHWCCLYAAIITEQPSELAPHAEALVRAAQRHQPAAVLAHAGRTWVSVLAGEVDAETVENAARSLRPLGLAWDGSRLAGYAAARCEDRRDMARLLACARELLAVRPATVAVKTSASLPHVGAQRSTAERDSNDQRQAGIRLGERERDVARLIIEGMTYREIGEALFLSPRTVEHHVANMRQRLAVQSRSELVSALRTSLADELADENERGPERGHGRPTARNSR